MNSRTIRVWTGETYECADFVEPRSEDELAAAIHRSRHVRFMGAGHSMIDRIVPAPGGSIIDMRRFQGMSLPEKPPTPAVQETTICVEGGVRLDVLTGELALRGWALATVPTQATVTAAGVISTGSHNTARTASALIADEVLGIEALDAAGARVSFSGEDLKAARVGLGALGAILRLTLRCVPAFDLIHGAVERDADATFGDLDTLIGKHDHLWLSWKLLPRNKERVVIRTADRITDVRPALPRIHAAERVPNWQRMAAKCTVSLARRFPALKPVLMASIGAKQAVIGASHHVFFQDVDWLEGQDASIAIPLASLATAREALRAAFRAAGYQPHLPILLRFLPASDKTLLGLNAGQAVAVLELMSFSSFDDFALGKRVFCETLAQFSPRAHWAKGAVGHITSSFPEQNWRAFEAMRARIDPEGKFVSPWLRSATPLAK